MRRENRFLISRRPYAVDLSSLTTTPYKVWPDDPEPLYINTLTAVWYRRRNGLTYACIGTLRHSTGTPPEDVHALLADYTDGRYGGNCRGRWDGSRYWGDEDIEVMQEYLAVLRPMIDNYPTIPPGYDGWWTFQ